MVRRRERRVMCPLRLRLDHGDLLVMDGSGAIGACTSHDVPGLQGPRVNLTYRWVTQHAASCPLAGVVGCVLPTCVQGLVEPSSRWLGEGENKWSSSWGLVLLLFILVFVLLVSTWIHIRKGASSQWSASIPLGGALHLSGSCPLGWETALATVTTSPIFLEGVSFYCPLVSVWENKTYSF